MYLVVILVLGQFADGLTYTMAHHGIELNSFMSSFGGLTLIVKFGGALLVGFLAWRLRHHPRLVLWLATVGWIGAITNFSGY